MFSITLRGPIVYHTCQHQVHFMMWTANLKYMDVLIFLSPLQSYEYIIQHRGVQRIQYNKYANSCDVVPQKLWITVADCVCSKVWSEHVWAESEKCQRIIEWFRVERIWGGVVRDSSPSLKQNYLWTFVYIFGPMSKAF